MARWVECRPLGDQLAAVAVIFDSVKPLGTGGNPGSLGDEKFKCHIAKIGHITTLANQPPSMNLCPSASSHRVPGCARRRYVTVISYGVATVRCG